jgi:serine/threonine protein kinase
MVCNPNATPFKQTIFDCGLQVMDKMRFVRELGNVLLIIHNEGYSHRDIKPDNLLIYDGRVVFSDFGLVSHEGIARLTVENEKVGPWNTIAPEMKRYPHSMRDFRPADVYSFAKLVWIILTEDEYCFDGQYDKDKKFSLESYDLEIETLECIHQLLMESTNDDLTSRPSIKGVLDQIDNWF